jgi:PAS domain S-box-containing protein
MSEMLPYQSLTPMTNRKILIIGDLKGSVDLSSLHPHEILRSKNLEGAFEVFTKARPDLVIYFAHRSEDHLEEHVMTWLLEGFRGKFIVFDPANRVKDSEVLIERQVVDEYLCGPVSPVRFISLIKSNLTRDVRFASPRAMTTFDLFRNLFDRCLNAIFFFEEESGHCVAANLRAERMMGYTLPELRQKELKDLCAPDHFVPTYRIIRRANRQYYDSKGSTQLLHRSGQKKEVAFSCGIFNFGRKNFVKMEVQDLPTGDARSITPALVRPSTKEDYFKDFRQGFNQASKDRSDLAMLTCRLRPLEEGWLPEQEKELMNEVEKLLQKNIRNTDFLTKVGPNQFVILLTQTPKDKAEKLVLRLIGQLSAISAFKSRAYNFEIEAGFCPPEAYPLMNLLQQAGSDSLPTSWGHPH